MLKPHGIKANPLVLLNLIMHIITQLATLQNDLTITVFLRIYRVFFTHFIFALVLYIQSLVRLLHFSASVSC